MSFDTELLRRRGLALIAAGLLAVSGAAAAGCGDDNNKGIDDTIENAADDAGDKIDTAADDAGDKIDTAADDVGDAAGDATNDVDDAVNGDK